MKLIIGKFRAQRQRLPVAEEGQSAGIDFSGCPFPLEHDRVPIQLARRFPRSLPRRQKSEGERFHKIVIRSRHPERSSKRSKRVRIIRAPKRRNPPFPPARRGEAPGFPVHPRRRGQRQLRPHRRSGIVTDREVQGNHAVFFAETPVPQFQRRIDPGELNPGFPLLRHPQRHDARLGIFRHRNTKHSFGAGKIERVFRPLGGNPFHPSGQCDAPAAVKFQRLDAVVGSFSGNLPQPDIGIHSKQPGHIRRKGERHHAVLHRQTAPPPHDVDLDDLVARPRREVDLLRTAGIP